MSYRVAAGAVAAMFLVGSAYAQAPVVTATDPEALFHSANPRLNANKQVIYHLIKDVLISGHTELADRYVSTRYIQHNPNIPSGREALVRFLAAMGPPRPIPAAMPAVIVAVTAEGDLVSVAQIARRHVTGAPSLRYTTTDFDMWRIKDGKADEHWDGAALDAPKLPKAQAPIPAKGG